MADNAPVRAPLLCRRYVVALFAACVATLVPPAAAQEKAGRSFTDTATTTVKGAAATALHSAQDLASAALSLIGIRYKWGGDSPETGLDCSGLVRYVFQQVTGVTLPRTAKDMSHVGTQVAASDLQPGDLVFFNTRRFAFSHVGIYLGDNRFIHAPRRGREVEIATFDSGFWQQRFNGARRMAGVTLDLIPSFVSEATAAPLAAAEAETHP
jgi:cell wall-associated NlpC family hydrolase